MKEYIFLGIASVIMISLISWLLVAAISGGEISECNLWQEDAAKYQGFYLVQWQADQCAAHDIKINAPVK